MPETDKETSLDLLQMDLIGKLIFISKEHKMAVDRYVEKNGLQKSQHRLLLMLNYLIETRQNVSQRDLAESLNVTPAAVAVTLKKLEKSGIVEKNTSEKDNRYNELAITPKGRQIVEDSKVAFRSADAVMFKGITRKEMEQLNGLLDRIGNNLHTMTEE